MVFVEVHNCMTIVRQLRLLANVTKVRFVGIMKVGEVRTIPVLTYSKIYCLQSTNVYQEGHLHVVPYTFFFIQKVVP